jgi:hypothetical protein
MKSLLAITAVLGLAVACHAQAVPPIAQPACDCNPCVCAPSACTCLACLPGPATGWKDQKRKPPGDGWVWDAKLVTWKPEGDGWTWDEKREVWTRPVQQTVNRQVMFDSSFGASACRS